MNLRQQKKQQHNTFSPRPDTRPHTRTLCVIITLSGGAIRKMSVMGREHRLHRISIDPSRTELDCLLCSLIQVVEGMNRKTAVTDDLLALLHIRAHESHDERLREASLFHCVHDPIGDDVATHDSTKDVDENGLDIWIALDDLKGCLDRLFVRPM